ncbi:type II secretion system protein [Campylobacter sp.]|uniref:type II secretion system protein n=1 Tax=Campylobacter sp. TaxID=205 RepID=UPI002A579412|nr:type II secretion system protein [Campylobacter sp.]MDD7090463.1 type II secretion system protein [Campylobacteraceae bacterium]MDY5284740.1 type II secretion system protein [Campylobacter sp.]
MKKAFTLVELIFVMVVLAIVAGIGTDILRSLFDNYAVTAQIHRLESVANNAADTIATRLEKRVPQTTAIETNERDRKYKPLSPITGGTAVNNGRLVFFRKAYELERNFISKKAGALENVARTSGFISELKTTTTTTTTTTTGDSRNFTDRVEFVSNDTADLNLDDFELFFSNDSSLLYENKGDHFDRYYSGNKSFAYQCAQGNIEFTEGKFILVRSNCPASTSAIVRPSMAALVHKFSLSREIDKIYLENNNLHLETCNINGRNCRRSLLATGVSTFRFSALGSDPNIASTIVFKLCLAEDEGKAELCQSRIVR